MALPLSFIQQMYIPMSEKPIITIAHQWFSAFNAHDLERLLALYADDAQHYSPKLKIRQPETEGLITGKDALRRWWQDSFDRLPSLKYEPQKFIADDSSVFMEYSRYVDGEKPMTVGEVLEIKDGLIVASRVYHS
jgi:ketosteroid isomerase-like protein